MRIAQIMCASLVTGLIVMPAAASAQDVQALRQEIDQLRKDIDRLNQEYAARLAALEAKLAGAPPPAEQPAPQPAAVPPAVAPEAQPSIATSAQAIAAGSKVFNPDMAVIGDFLGAAGTNPVHPDPFSLGGDHPNALQMHESEASFQAVVDPYARADFFISFGEEGVDLEEGFVTFTSLPGGLLTRVGKMRAAFGKVNSLHNHVLPWADRPLVTYNLVGGEDGIDDAGISVARLIPNPWLFLEATGQVFRGDSGGEGSPLFATTRRSELSYVTHLRGYQDITEDSNIDLGFSYSYGHNGIVNPAGDGSLATQLYGIDGTFRWRPLQRSIYHSFIARSEWIWSRRDQAAELGGLQVADGGYVSGDYQLARRWFAGARLDRSGHPDNASITDTGASLLLTYWPSEFSQVRAQYRHTNYGVGATANELLFQFQFSIGAHGAHPF
ncbi:MAG TPA: hypothetical protein VKH42_14825 [Vicinamibacterales bacterium]|nr:hypothetical protein [Vicinamibacterales bacterium]